MSCQVTRLRMSERRGCIPHVFTYCMAGNAIVCCLYVRTRLSVVTVTLIYCGV